VQLLGRRRASAQRHCDACDSCGQVFDDALQAPPPVDEHYLTSGNARWLFYVAVGDLKEVITAGSTGAASFLPRP
jgi:hypothetical protein